MMQGVGLRLIALTINGTFRGFAFSPHIRGFGSLVGVVVWLQISLGFLVAYVSAGRDGSANGRAGAGAACLEPRA
jgi:hypothetical protein